jgi:Fanconi anemia group M protein
MQVKEYIAKAREVWPTLVNFRDDSRFQDWCFYAERLIEKILNGSVIVVGDTGVGKTVVTLMAQRVLDCRTILFVPKKALAGQHAKMFAAMCEDQCAVIIGETKERNWSDDNIKIVFATPQTFMFELNKGRTSIDWFELCILDECHHTVGVYDYVSIARLAQEKKVTRIGLTASVGSEKKREELRRAGQFEQPPLYLDIKMPKKQQGPVFAEPTETLLEIERYYEELLATTVDSLRRMKIEIAKDTHLTNSELIALEEEIKGWPSYYRDKYMAISVHAQYRKLQNGYWRAMTENYASFLSHANRMAAQTQKGNKAAQAIIKHPLFRKIVALARENHDEHPKVLQFLTVAHSFRRMKKIGMSFVAYKDTGVYLTRLLREAGFRVAFASGGSGKKTDELAAIYQQLGERGLDQAVSTSVSEEGIDIPELNFVISYSLPQYDIPRIQRAGRTARNEPGNVVYIVLNHWLDKSTYYRAMREERKMRDYMQGFDGRQYRLFP